MLLADFVHPVSIHLFTYRQFDNGVLGLAYIASERQSAVGGLCSPCEYTSIHLKTIWQWCTWSSVYCLRAAQRCWRTLFTVWVYIFSTPVFSGHSKRRPKIGFQDRLSLNAGQKYCRMLQESILQHFWPSLSYHLSLRPLFCLFLSGRLRQVLLYSPIDNLTMVYLVWHILPQSGTVLLGDFVHPVSIHL